MEIKISANPKEIAHLILAIQGRHESGNIEQPLAMLEKTVRKAFDDERQKGDKS